MKILRQLVSALYHFSVIAFYKLNGPPRILNFESPLNVKILRSFGAKIGENCQFNAPITINSSPPDHVRFANLIIGDEVLLNGNNYLDLMTSITLEDGVSLGPGVTIMTHNRYNLNPYLEEVMAHTCARKPVLIGKGSGIKAHALIGMGVTIGEDAIIAGGAVVNRDVAPRTMVGGVPAKVIREFESSSPQEQELLRAS